MSERQIITSYIVISKDGPVGVTTNQDEAVKWKYEKEAEGVQTRVIDYTTNLERLHQIGQNLFSIKIPIEAQEDPIGYRNNLISDFNKSIEHYGEVEPDINNSAYWRNFTVDHNLTCTFDDFQQCLFDRATFTYEEKDS
jgi:hypothetical protein